MATDGKQGELPAYLSHGLQTSGFYTFRTGWKEDATMMVVKAGPPAFWHNQPDNGTFELYINGRNFFPDAGSYVYAGNDEVQKERDWFRQTMVHKTLTLDNANIKTMNTKCLLWDVNSKTEKLVVENPSYEGLSHRRAIFFVDKKFFVIVDEAAGEAKGDVAIHYQLCAGKVAVDNAKNEAITQFEDGNNVVLRTFGAKDMQMLEEEGWMSTAYRKKEKRAAFAFQNAKNSNEPVRYITVIYPIEKTSPTIAAKFDSPKMEEKAVIISLKVDGKKYALQANW